MRIALSIAEGVVHTVHYRISAGNKVARTLTEPREKVKQLFTFFARSVHLVGCVPVQEKCMEKQG